MGSLGMGEPVFVRVTDAQGTADLQLSWVDTFGNVPPGEALLYEDSYGRLTIAVNQGSAADLLGLREDAEVVITRAPLASGYDPTAYEPAGYPQVAYDAGSYAPAPYDPPPFEPTGYEPPTYEPPGSPNGNGSVEGGDQAWAMPPAPEPDPTAR